MIIDKDYLSLSRVVQKATMLVSHNKLKGDMCLLVARVTITCRY